MEQIQAFVLAHRAGRVTPVPTLDRAIVWAKRYGSESKPVIVMKNGKEVYRWPE